MARFVVYTYQFSPTSTINLRIGEKIIAMQKRMENKQLYFQDILDNLSNDKLHFSYRKKQYKHKTYLNEQNIVVFKLANNTNTFIEDDFNRQAHPNHPSCFIIIDNRRDIQHILIEDNNVAFSNTDVVKNILVSFFTHRLEEYGLKISINKAYQENEFWNTIKLYPEGIQMVRVQMAYPNLPSVWHNIGDVIKESSIDTNSHKTSIEFNSEQGDLLKLDDKNENLKSLVDASAESGIPIVLKVKGVRAYKKTGKTEKSLDIDSLEAVIQPNMFQTAFERISEKLNKIFR